MSQKKAAPPDPPCSMLAVPKDMELEFFRPLSVGGFFVARLEGEDLAASARLTFLMEDRAF